MARHFIFVALVFSLAATGCSSCDDDAAGGSTNANNVATDAGADASGNNENNGNDGGATDAGTEDSGANDGGGDDAGMTDGGVDMGMACPTARDCAGTCCEVGDVCVLDQCLPPCDSGVRCGADLATCCAQGDVCINDACTTPGDMCLDSFDCAPGEYCEPTISQCLPSPNVACEVRPQPEPFSVAIEWHWQGVASDPTYKRVMSTPTVADLDLDGTPDMVINAYDDGCAGDAILVAIDGATGVEKWAVTDPAYRTECSSHPAIGNLDADPELEVVAIADGTGGIMAFDHDGTFLWRYNAGSAALRNDLASLSLADVDADGTTEVVMGGLVVNHDGTLQVDHGMLGMNWATGSSPIATVADVNGDGMMELIGGGKVVELDGNVLWEDFDQGRDGYPAVADFFGDGTPDIVSIRRGNARIQDAVTGALLFGPVAIPGAGRGGPPTVADFDGDGSPEFSTAGNGRYAVYDPDCTGTPDPATCPSERTDGILWDIPVQDLSSNATGSSVFDFEEDGRAEVIYNDECSLYVLDGVDGTILLQRANSSRTGTENPIVVDVDGDGNSEIVVPANDDQIGRDNCAVGTFGVFAFGDPNDNWVRTRRVWNQHTYHVTNVTSDGQIPQMTPLNWLDPSLNNFRQNVQGEGVFNAPDLRVDVVQIGDATCSGTLEASVLIRVSNQGALGVAAGVPVRVTALKAGETMPVEIGVVPTTRVLLPGAFEDLTLQWTVPSDFIDAGFELFAEIDPDGTVSECIEDNNSASDTYTDVTFAAPEVTISDFTANSNACRGTNRLPFRVTLQNAGTAAVPAGLPVDIEISAPNSTFNLTLQTAAPLNPGATVTLDGTWNVPGNLTGVNVTAVATVDPDQLVLTCDASETATLTTVCPVIQ